MAVRWRRGLVATAWAIFLPCLAAGQEPVEPPTAGTSVVQLDEDGWFKVLGWSADGLRLAWRSGSTGRTARGGSAAPCSLAQLDAGGHVTAREPLERCPAADLRRQGIRAVKTVASEQVGQRDVLLRSRDGSLLAAVLREGTLALLRKTGSGYGPVWRLKLPHPASSLRAFGWERPQGGSLALVLEAHEGKDSVAQLLVVDLAAAVTATAP